MIEIFKMDINIRDKNGNTPLYYVLDCKKPDDSYDRNYIKTIWRQQE